MAGQTGAVSVKGCSVSLRPLGGGGAPSIRPF